MARVLKASFHCSNCGQPHGRANRVVCDSCLQTRKRTKLPVERVRALLEYDQQSGLFRWKSGARKGLIAGSLTAFGYIHICVDRSFYYAHHLAWFYVHGAWPDQIDHINCRRSDNRLSNLRQGTQSQNNANRRPAPSKSGLKGAFYRPHAKKWQGYASGLDGKQIHLGYFDTAEAAHEAHKMATIERFGEFARFA